METEEAISKQESVTKKKKGLIMWMLKQLVQGRAPGLVVSWHVIDVLVFCVLFGHGVSSDWHFLQGDKIYF